MLANFKLRHYQQTRICSKMDLIEDLDTRGIKPGDFVIRKAHGAEPVEDSFQ
jgi:hypothetical protein